MQHFVVTNCRNFIFLEGAPKTTTEKDKVLDFYSLDGSEWTDRLCQTPVLCFVGQLNIGELAIGLDKKGRKICYCDYTRDSKLILVFCAKSLVALC